MTKENFNTIYTQSAVIPYREKNGQFEVLLITSLKKRHWIIPKGIIEDDMSPPESAMNEAFEEAGIIGKIESEPLGTYHYKKWGGICHVHVYACEVTKIHNIWPEMRLRVRKWFPVTDMAGKIHNNQLAGIIKKFIDKKLSV